MVIYVQLANLDAFVQRIGRASHGPVGNGEGWLIFEPWVQSEKSKGTGKSKRKCHPLLKALLLETRCRQRYLNRVYANPQAGVLVADRECCDICDPESSSRLPCRTFEPGQGPPGAAAVSGDVDPDMLSCLQNWREAIAPTVFGPDSLCGPEALISDHDIERVSCCRPLPSIEQLHRYLTKWPDLDEHFESMWNALEEGGYPLSRGPEASLSILTPCNTGRPPPLQTPGASSSSHGVRNPAPTQHTTQTHALAPSYHRWWNAYIPEWNYQVQDNVTMEDFRCIFPSPPREALKRKQPATSTAPAPATKRLRSNPELGQ
ncbi:hypothetical protein FRC11_012808, partial [Ceratobasidium sp. 423]